MSAATPPVGEYDLHAYVDGQLSAERRPAVERYLAETPEAARKVADYQVQREAIRAAFAARTVEPLPPELTLARIIARRGRVPRMPWLVAASVLLALGLGLAGGWLLRAPSEPGRTELAMALLKQQALASHVVYSVDTSHSVEVPGTEAPYLQQWLSNRLQRVVVAPDLSTFGYHLVGGRLLATERGGASALLIYDDANQHRISVLLRPMAPPLHAREADFEKDGVNGCAWIANGLGVAVVAALPESDLAPLAARIGTDLGAPV
jgi:anti-sigma factor RsiW